MKNPFAEHMARLSDMALLRVFAERQDYVPEALRAAEEELDRRKIPQNIVEQAIEVGKQAQAIALERKNIPLSSTWKALYFVFAPFALSPIVVFFFRYHADRDYDLRSVESINMTFLGLLFYMAAYGVLLRTIGPFQTWF